MADIALHQLGRPVLATHNAYTQLVDNDRKRDTSWDSWENFGAAWNAYKPPEQLPSAPPVVEDNLLYPEIKDNILPLEVVEPKEPVVVLPKTEDLILASDAAVPLPPIEPSINVTIAMPIEATSPVELVKSREVAAVVAVPEVPAVAVKEPPPVAVEPAPVASATPLAPESPTIRLRRRKSTTSDPPTDPKTDSSTDRKEHAVAPPSSGSVVIGWFLTILHYILYAYEWISFEGITLVDSLIFDGAEWSWIVWLGMNGEEVNEYSYLGKMRSWPKWYTIFRHVFAIFTGGVLAITLFCYIFLPAAPMIANMVVAAEIQQIYMDTPLPPEFVKDYIHDYAHATAFESLRLERIKNRENALQDAETEAERRALEDYDLLDHDGDGTYTKYEAKTFADVTKAKGLAALDESFWDDSSARARHPTYGQQKHAEQQPQQVRVDPIMPIPTLMCDLQPQYYRMRTNIVLRKGCFDMQQYALDLTYNPRWPCKQAQAKEVRLEAEKQGRSYVAKLNEYIARCRAEEQEMLNSEIGVAEQACVCNAHYGMPQLWVYSATPGREPIFLIEPRIVPMNYSDYTTRGVQTAVDDKEGETNPFDHMVLRTMVEGADTPLGKIDKILYKELNLNPNVRQPPHQILVDAYVLASRDTMREFYGDVYGPSSTAFMDARSSLQQEVKEAEKANTDGQITATLNQAGHYFKKKWDMDTESTTHESVNNLVMQTRGKIESGRRKAILASSSAETNTTTITEQMWGTLASLAGSHYETKNAAERRRLMELDTPGLQKKTNLPVLAPHSVCVTKCIQLQDAMDLERQKTFDRDVLNLVVTAYSLPTLNFVVRQ